MFLVSLLKAFEDRPSWYVPLFMVGVTIPFSIVILGLWFGRRVKLQNQRLPYIITYEKGFAYRRGKSWDFINYDDISNVRVKRVVITGTVYKNICEHIFSTPQGQSCTIDLTVDNGEALAESIAELVWPRLLTETLARLDAGQVVVCSPLTLDHSGINYKGKHIAWDKVADVSLAQGFLIIATDRSAGSPWLKLEARAIDNLFVIIALWQVQRDSQGE